MQNKHARPIKRILLLVQKWTMKTCLDPNYRRQWQNESNKDGNINKLIPTD